MFRASTPEAGRPHQPQRISADYVTPEPGRAPPHGGRRHPDMRSSVDHLRGGVTSEPLRIGAAFTTGRDLPADKTRRAAEKRAPRGPAGPALGPGTPGLTRCGSAPPRTPAPAALLPHAPAAVSSQNAAHSPRTHPSARSHTAPPCTASRTMGWERRRQCPRLPLTRGPCSRIALRVRCICLQRCKPQNSRGRRGENAPSGVRCLCHKAAPYDLLLEPVT